MPPPQVESPEHSTSHCFPLHATELHELVPEHFIVHAPAFEQSIAPAQEPVPSHVTEHAVAVAQSTPSLQEPTPLQSTAHGIPGGHVTRPPQPAGASHVQTHQPPSHVPPSQSARQFVCETSSPASSSGPSAPVSSAAVTSSSLAPSDPFGAPPSRPPASSPSPAMPPTTLSPHAVQSAAAIASTTRRGRADVSELLPLIDRRSYPRPLRSGEARLGVARPGHHSFHDTTNHERTSVTLLLTFEVARADLEVDLARARRGDATHHRRRPARSSSIEPLGRGRRREEPHVALPSRRASCTVRPP